MSQRKYPTNADRQRAYRARQELKALGLDTLLTALQHAADRGGAHRLVDNLPDDPAGICHELARRLDTVKLCAFKLPP